MLSATPTGPHRDPAAMVLRQGRGDPRGQASALALQARIDLADGALRGWQLQPTPPAGPSALVALLDQALAWSAGAQALGHELPLTLNLSTAQLIDPTLPDLLLFLLRQHGLPPSRLELGFSAPGLQAGGAPALAGLQALRRAGLTLTLTEVDEDDPPIPALPLRRHRLSARRVAALAERNGSALDAVQRSIEQAHGQGLRCVAAGIETPEQLRLLRRLRCDEGEGPLLARPLSATQALRQLKGPWPWLPLLRPNTRSLTL